MPDQLRKLGVSSIQLPGVNVLLEFADAWERDRQHLANAEAQRDQLRDAARNVLSHEHPDGGYLVLTVDLEKLREAIAATEEKR